jgi:hypothetical protein
MERHARFKISLRSNPADATKFASPWSTGSADRADVAQHLFLIKQRSGMISVICVSGLNGALVFVTDVKSQRNNVLMTLKLSGT